MLFTKLKLTINPPSLCYSRGDNNFQRNLMISENAWNALTRNGGNVQYIKNNSLKGYIFETTLTSNSTVWS